MELTLFNPDDMGEEVCASAKVARVEHRKSPDLPAGFGVEFTRIDDADLARLRRMLRL